MPVKDVSKFTKADSFTVNGVFGGKKQSMTFEKLVDFNGSGSDDKGSRPNWIFYIVGALAALIIVVFIAGVLFLFLRPKNAGEDSSPQDLDDSVINNESESDYSRL